MVYYKYLEGKHYIKEYQCLSFKVYIKIKYYEQVLIA